MEENMFSYLNTFGEWDYCENSKYPETSANDIQKGMHPKLYIIQLSSYEFKFAILSKLQDNLLNI